MTIDQFVNKYLGKRVREPGFRYECVALAKVARKELYDIELGRFGGSALAGRANTTGTFDGYTKVITGTPSPGDMVFFGKMFGIYGHVAIVVEASDTSIKVLEQNGGKGAGNGRGSDAIRLHTYSYDKVVGRYQATPSRAREGRSMVDKIRDGTRPHEPATRLEAAIMADRLAGIFQNKLNVLQQSRIRDTTKPIVDERVDAALDESDNSYELITDRMSLEEMRNLPSSSTSYYKEIKRDPSLQLDQDEFESRSNRCTLYANLASLPHWGITTEMVQREELYQWYQDNGFYENGRGASTVEVSKIRGTALKETGIYTGTVNTYILESDSIELALLLYYHNQYVVMSTMLSDNLNEDRKDNMFIDGEIHGGRTYGGHAHGLCAVDATQALRVNSYYERRNNHAVLPKSNHKEYMTDKRSPTKTYARKYAVIHIYS